MRFAAISMPCARRLSRYECAPPCHAADSLLVSTTSDHLNEAGAEFLTRLRADVAAELTRADFWAAAEVLLDSPLLDSVPRRLARQFADLDLAGAQDIFADGLDALIQHWQSGGRPDRPDGYLFKTCWYKAQDEVNRRRDFAQLEEGRVAGPGAEEDDPEASRETLRREALRVAREALPRITQERPREALELILDAVERGIELTNAGLGEQLGVTSANARKLRERAFKRLEGALNEMGAHPTLQWAFELEQQQEAEDDEADDYDDEEDR